MENQDKVKPSLIRIHRGLSDASKSSQPAWSAVECGGRSEDGRTQGPGQGREGQGHGA